MSHPGPDPESDAGSADQSRPPLELFPNSLRIQRSTRKMVGAARRADAIGKPRIRFIEVPPERDYEVVQVDGDPAHMTRLKVTEAPREIERPATTWEAFERITPQFFLRNTHRIERYADLSLYEYIRTPDGRLSLKRVSELVQAALHPAEPPLNVDLGSASAHAWWAERSVLMSGTAWGDHFGREDAPVLADDDA